MKIVLPNERPISWNKFYAGMHWTIRQKEAQRAHLLVRYATPKDALRFQNKVHITITVYFKGRPLDPDNIACKFYIDGLKYAIINDDTREWVDGVTMFSRIDKKNPRLEIDINEVLTKI